MEACPTPLGPEGSNGKQGDCVPRVSLVYGVKRNS